MKYLDGPSSRVLAPLKFWAPRFAFALLVAATLALMVMGRFNSAIVERARAVVMDGVTPVLDVISRPVDAMADVMASIEDLSELRADNAALRQENARLKTWQAAAMHLEGENQALRELLKLVPDPTLRFISARVVGDPGGAFVRSVLVNAGSDHGVRLGQAAITGDGLAGRISQAGRHSARLLLITDINSRVPVTVGSRRNRGVLGGDNTETPRLLYLDPEVTVVPGDRVVTSGHGGAFPPGIPVGVVSEVSELGVRVRPVVDLRRIEFVRLLDYVHLPTDEAPAEGLDAAAKEIGATPQTAAPQTATAGGQR
ncbi:MAG TPA: rod shape-determining protein MreC [Kiloniellaceae bacterium]|nr:rod shape-determining protein MreC [Kiloniellaceae bacterium]